MRNRREFSELKMREVSMHGNNYRSRTAAYNKFDESAGKPQTSQSDFVAGFTHFARSYHGCCQTLPITKSLGRFQNAGSGKWEVGSGKWEVGSRKSEVGSRNAECGMRNAEALTQGRSVHPKCMCRKATIHDASHCNDQLTTKLTPKLFGRCPNSRSATANL